MNGDDLVEDCAVLPLQCRTLLLVSLAYDVSVLLLPLDKFHELLFGSKLLDRQPIETDVVCARKPTFATHHTRETAANVCGVNRFLTM